ncbi:MAG: 4-hydroxy-tetrahydrodipicolinate synthase [Armatimonadetes bacterium]|nr:4-hydroxy-tetrahydrodipicolinate synthase [Armatimonadota bacterium]
MIRPEGSWVALVTPFTEQDTIDVEGLRTLIDFQIAHGTAGLLVMGSAGEATLLSADERRRVTDAAMEATSGRIPVFVGTTCLSTRETVELSRYAERARADGLLLLVPPYVNPSQDAIAGHFRAVASAVSLPLAVYNNPSRVGVNIDPPTIIRLAEEIPTLVADKEAMGRAAQVEEVLEGTGGRLRVLCCDFPGYGLLFPTLGAGGHGTANISGNVIPREMAEMSQPWRSMDDVQRTRRVYFQCLPLLRAMYWLSNPIVVKAALRLLGLPAGRVRAPLEDLRGGRLEQLGGLLDQLGVTSRYGRVKPRAR